MKLIRDTGDSRRSKHKPPAVMTLGRLEIRDVEGRVVFQEPLVASLCVGDYIALEITLRVADD